MRTRVGTRRSVWVPVAYLLLTAAALALPFLLGAPLAGIWAALLTLPWCIVLMAIMHVIDPGLMDGGFGPVAVGLGAAINATLLHGLLRRSEHRVSTERRNAAPD